MFNFFKKKNECSDTNRQVKKDSTIISTPVEIATPKAKSCKPAGIPSKKPLKQMTISPVGITYDCKKTDKFSRQDIMINLHEGDIVKIEKYKYKGKDAYLLIDTKYDADFGVINAQLANDISNNFGECEFEAYVSKTDYFYPEEDSDDYINTCKVKLYILPKEK